jgi:hypothetical protein
MKVLAWVCAMFVAGCGQPAKEQEVKPQTRVARAEVAVDAALTAKERAQLDAAFAELQDASLVDVRRTAKTDRGYALLRELGASNAAERAYIAEKLPALIAAGPRCARPDIDDPRWRNELDLADDLKIVEAAPAMVRQIEWGGSMIGGLTEASSIEHRPAAMALVTLGDAAIPALQEGIEHGDALSLRTPYYCSIALVEIRTPAAKEALMQSSLRQQDPHTYQSMMKRLDSK